MKRFIFISIVASVLALVLSSCKWESVAQYTPTVQAFNFLCYTSGAEQPDTMTAYYRTDGYWMDTIMVGDSVRFNAYLQSYANNLTSFGLTSSDGTVLQFGMEVDSLKPALDPTTNLETHTLVFKTGFNAALFPISYVAKRAGTTKVKLEVHSDSQFEMGSLDFTQVVIEAPQPEED